MAFYLYKKLGQSSVGIEKFERVKEIRLAGYNCIHDLWIKKGKPLDQGWHIDIHEILSYITGGSGNYNSHRIIIDWDPKSNRRIGLIELLDIYLYTYGNPDNKAIWSALMLKLREFFYENLPQGEDKNLIEEKKKIVSINQGKKEEIIEFLYLKGDGEGWNWGRVGQVNAVFIDEAAREYFRKFF